MYNTVDNRKPYDSNFRKHKYFTKTDIQKLEEDKILKLRSDQIQHGIYDKINGSIEEQVLKINDKLD